jgi:hypothetical protein
VSLRLGKLEEDFCEKKIRFQTAREPAN